MRHRIRTHRRLAGFVLLISVILPTVVVHAETVFKCRGADGAVAYQDRACATSQVGTEVEIAPAPPVAPSPDYGRASESTRTVRSRGVASRSGRSTAAAEVVSYECRAANGEVFYRHGACPKQITAKATSGGSRKRGNAGKESYAVTTRALPRGEVCREMTRAGSIGRGGHERDESISSYDRNLGRDPCRKF